MLHRVWVLVLFCTFTHGLWAQGQSQFELGLSAVSYLSDSPAVDTSKSNVFSALSLSWQGQYRGDYLARAHLVGLVTLNNTEQSYLNIPEAFVDSNSSGSWNFGLGRRDFSWSEMDRYWKLGVWQPRFRWDYLNPGQTGLTGIYLRHEKRAFSLKFFVSPLFVPEQGAPFDLSNGKCVSQSPWFSCPGREIEILNSVAQFDYFLEMPPIKQLILNPSAVLQLQWGNKNNQWLSAGWAHKPINQILLALSDVQLSASETQGSVRIHPLVQYHQLYSLEGGQRFGPWTWLAGIHHERPLDLTTNSQWTQQNLFSNTLLNFQNEWKFNNLHPQRAPEISLGYLRVLGKKDIATGKAVEDGILDKSVFDQRFSFRNALSLGVRSPFPGSERWSLQGRLLYDLSDSAVLLSSELSHLFTMRWLAVLGLDILSGSSGVVGSSFISQYRANDRIRAGLQYVF